MLVWVLDGNNAFIDKDTFTISNNDEFNVISSIETRCCIKLCTLKIVLLVCCSTGHFKNASVFPDLGLDLYNKK